MVQLAFSRESTPDSSVVASVLVPAYVDVGGGRVLARFADAAAGPDSLEIQRNRVRAYPGLPAAAPRTDSFYRAFSAYVAGRRVLDVGCGAGVGLSYLDGASAICAVDCDPSAVWFAKNAVSGIEVLQADAATEALPASEVGILVDVLGQVAEPRDVIRRVGTAIGEGGLLCIAEPHASIAQELCCPVRRAFSKQQLEALLCDGGFVVQEWLSEGGFLCAVAERRSTEWTRGLEAADRLRAEGLEGEALDLLLSPPKVEDHGAAPAWYLRIAEICLARGDGDGALEALLEIQARAPDDARVLSMLAQLTLGMGAMDDASRFAIAAAQRDPAEATVAFSLARAVGDKLPPAEKVALWSNAARLAPADVDAAVALAQNAAGHEAYHLGIRALERVREYHPTLPADFHLTLGWMYLMSARVEDALMECRLATVVDSDNPAIAELLAAICEVRPRPMGVS